MLVSLEQHLDGRNEQRIDLGLIALVHGLRNGSDRRIASLYQEWANRCSVADDNGVIDPKKRAALETISVAIMAITRSEPDDISIPVILKLTRGHSYHNGSYGHSIDCVYWEHLRY